MPIVGRTSGDSNPPIRSSAARTTSRLKSSVA